MAAGYPYAMIKSLLLVLCLWLGVVFSHGLISDINITHIIYAMIMFATIFLSLEFSYVGETQNCVKIDSF